MSNLRKFDAYLTEGTTVLKHARVTQQEFDAMSKNASEGTDGGFYWLAVKDAADEVAPETEGTTFIVFGDDAEANAVAILNGTDPVAIAHREGFAIESLRPCEYRLASAAEKAAFLIGVGITALGDEPNPACYLAFATEEERAAYAFGLREGEGWFGFTTLNAEQVADIASALKGTGCIPFGTPGYAPYDPQDALPPEPLPEGTDDELDESEDIEPDDEADLTDLTDEDPALVPVESEKTEAAV